jgi:hypothetical protein
MNEWMKRDGEQVIVPRQGLLAADHYYLAQLAETYFRIEEGTRIYVTNTGAEVRIPVDHSGQFWAWVRSQKLEPSPEAVKLHGHSMAKGMLNITGIDAVRGPEKPSA